RRPRPAQVLDDGLAGNLGQAGRPARWDVAMSGREILSQAMAHLPALVLVYGTIFGAYWLLGLIRWPRLAQREELLDRLGSLDGGSLAASSMSGLMLISLLSLFLELLLIRWVASEIRVFAYFKSLVLIACFLGFGLGCYLCRRRVSVLPILVPLLTLVLLIRSEEHTSELQSR